MGNATPFRPHTPVDRTLLAVNAGLIGLFVGWGTALRASETLGVQALLATVVAAGIAVGLYVGLLLVEARTTHPSTVSGSIPEEGIAADGGNGDRLDS